MVKFKVTLNWYGENLTFWTTLSRDNPTKAVKNCLNQLADKLKITTYSVRQYFASNGNKITIETEKTE